MMHKRINIKETESNHEQLLLQTDSSIENLIPRGQMLVDSDGFSFIYLMDNEEEYTYLILGEEIWPLLKQAKDEQWTVILKNSEDAIELVSFHEELSYLTENIKGNSNYGDEMVEKVEKLF